MDSLKMKRKRWEPDESQLATIRGMLAKGEGQRAIARVVGVSESIINRVMQEHRLPYLGKQAPQTLHRDPTPEEIAERAAVERANHLAVMRERGPKGEYCGRMGNPRVCKVMV